MIALKADNSTFKLTVFCEETIDHKVKITVSVAGLEIQKDTIGDNYHDAIWNLHSNLHSLGLKLLCNGVSLDVFPSAMQFDMGLAYTGYRLKMGMATQGKDVVVLLDYNSDAFVECTKTEQLAFYKSWVQSKKRSESMRQSLDATSIDPANGFIFFWGHQASSAGDVTKACLSQWWPCSFYQNGIKYNSSEQWMMAEKARIFSDSETLEKILATTDPDRIKKLGREISFFDEEVWRIKRYEVVYEGNLLKFSQNEPLKKFLLNTGSKTLVEASPYDKIWGIGMNQNHAGIDNPKNWLGQNLLGFVLMEVRSELGRSVG